MIGLRDTRNKPAIVFNAVHATVLIDAALAYVATQFSPIIIQKIDDVGLPAASVYTITQYNATAFQRTSVSTVVTLETFAVDLFDVTVTTQILELPNLVPNADISNSGGWTTAPLWSKVNTPGSSTTWITSTNANGSTCRLRFTVPTVASPATLRLFRRKSGGTSDPAFIWTLFRDGTQVQTNSLTLTNTEFTQTDYPLDSDLVAGAVYEVELTRSGGGGPSARGVVDMAAIWIDPT